MICSKTKAVGPTAETTCPLAGLRRKRGGAQNVLVLVPLLKSLIHFLRDLRDQGTGHGWTGSTASSAAAPEAGCLEQRKHAGLVLFVAGVGVVRVPLLGAVSGHLTHPCSMLTRLRPPPS